MAMTIADRNRLREEEELAVGRLLARAKLFRVRQQWDEAIAACTDALRRYPLSVTACSLLGEIYEAQGRLEDAAQWYGMALERDPQNNSDRNGWERVTAAQRARQATETAPSSPEPTNSTILPVAEKTLDWLDRLFPPGDNRSIARMLYAVSGVVALLLLIAAVTFYLFFQNQPRKGLADVRPSGGGVGNFPTPVVVESPSHGIPAQSVSPKVSATVATDLPSPAPTDADPEDMRLLGEVNHLLNGNFVLQSLTRDDNGGVALELLVPSGETLEKSKEVVLRAVYSTAKLVSQADPSLQTSTIKAFMPSSTNPATPVRVFTGDIALAPLRTQDTAPLGYLDILSRFTRLQWEGPLATAYPDTPNPTESAPLSGNSTGAAQTTGS
jgi:hypothetical protein